MTDVLLVAEADTPVAACEAQLRSLGASVRRLDSGGGLDAIGTVDLCLASFPALSQLRRGVRGGASTAPVVAFGADEAAAAVAALREGAMDYWPLDAGGMLPLARLQAALAAAAGARTLALPAAASRQAYDLAARVAGIDIPVLVTGESGTGKEVLARFIHDRSPRSRRPFVAVNCAAIPENMLEATMFGHERGAFTGAQQARPGKFQLADGGTLLLDEIGELPLELQAKLLRALQEREVEAIGAKHPVPVDVRVIATTNVNLQEAIAAGRFREDLFYRLSVFPIRLAPLRERPEDIEPLAQVFVRKHGLRLGIIDKQLTPAIAAQLQLHDWPGNVRELENTVQRALVLAGPEPFHSGHFELPAQRPASSDDLAGRVQAEELQIVLEALARHDGRRADTASALGISERTLRYKLARLRESGFNIPS